MLVSTKMQSHFLHSFLFQVPCNSKCRALKISWLSLFKLGSTQCSCTLKWHSLRKMLLKLCLPRQNKIQTCSDCIMLKVFITAQLHHGYTGGRIILIKWEHCKHANVPCHYNMWNEERTQCFWNFVETHLFYKNHRIHLKS